MSKSWTDISKNLDPNMPEKDYNNIRIRFFNDVVRPKIDPKYSVDATYKDFLERTERPLTIKARQMGAEIGSTITNLAVQGLEIGALTAAVGPLTAAASQELLGATKVAQVVAKVARGGLAFGAYDALEAKDGDRVAAGLRGATWGILAELGLGAVFGFDEKAAGEIVKKSVNNEPIRDPRRLLQPTSPGTEGAGFTRRPGTPSPESGFTHRPAPAQIAAESEPLDVEWRDVHDPRQLSREEQLLLPESSAVTPGPRLVGTARGSGGKVRRVFEAPGVVAETLQKNVVEARAKGYLTGPMVETPGIKGLRVIVKDAEGMPTILNVPRGTESDIVGQIQETLQNGGSIDGVHFHPASRARASELMRHFAENAEAEETTLRMRTAKGNAGVVAKQLNKMGLRGTVADDSTVLVGTEAPWVKAKKAKELAAAGEKFVAEGGKAPDLSDEIGKNLFRQGELRTMMQAGKGTRALYAELHHLQGELGQRVGIPNRTDLGKLGLRYFERTVNGETVDAAKMIEDYKGPRSPIGERPPAGNRPEDASGTLKGYRSPSPTPSEGMTWDADEKELYEAEGKIRVRPVGTTKVIPQTGEELGFTGAAINSPDGPMRILSRDAGRQTMYHENVHDGLNHVGLDDQVPSIVGDHKVTGIQIAQGLMGEWSDAYKEFAPKFMMNEAYTHAAEAVRFNNEPMLEQLGRWDTSVDHVKAFVHDTSENALEHSYATDSAPARAFQRRMIDLMRRTDPERTAALQRAAVSGYRTWFNPEIGQWVMRDGEGREYLKGSLGDVWDHIDQADPSSHFPDIGHKAYFKGLRGPMVPTGMEPVDGPVTLESEHLPLGWQSIRSIFQPTLDWAASVQKKIMKYGVKDLDFYGAVKSVDEARKLAAPEADRLDEGLRAIFKGVSKGRRSDYGELLAVGEDQWSTMGEKLGLSAEDLANVRSLKDWDDANVSAGGTSMVDALSTMKKVREAGGDINRALGGKQTAAGEAIKNGALGYADLHAGQVSRWAIRKSIDDRFMNEPIKALEKILSTKTSSGKLLLEPIQWAGRNYVNYMRGIPDASQKILDSWVGGMIKFGEARAKDLNQYLPEGMKITENLGTPRELLSRYQLLLYTAGLGARPAVYIRDTFQGMYSLAVMGPTTFAEGMARALTQEGRAEAHAAGALLHGRNVGEFFGDISGDLPVSGRVSDFAVKMADKLLSPSRMGHNLPRMVTFLGEKQRALREIARYRAGEITDPMELANRTAVWFQDEAPRMRLLSRAADKSIPIDQVATEFGLALNDAAQFALRSGTQGAGLRTGMGRIMGQYGTWPMNYIEFTRKLAARSLENPGKGVPALGAWMAINYGAFKAADAIGVDAAKWLFFSPAGYAGSPNLELLQNVMKAPEESNEGLAARRKLHDIPMEFMPMGVQANNIYRAFQDGDTSLPRLLGFHMKKDQGQEQDLDTWLLTEMGFGNRP